MWEIFIGHQNWADGTICNDRSKRAMTPLPSEGVVGDVNFLAGPGQDPEGCSIFWISMTTCFRKFGLERHPALEFWPITTPCGAIFSKILHLNFEIFLHFQ